MINTTKIFLRTYGFPIIATAAAIAFWWHYRGGGYFWWLVVIGVILISNVWVYVSREKDTTGE